MNLITGQVVYVGDGKDSDALDGFWKKVKKVGCVIKFVTTDLSAAFISSVMSNAPDAVLVFDHFRRGIYRVEKDLNKRKALKGTKWILLCNGKDIFDQKVKSRLDNALNLNEPLMKAYYLKESLKEIWMQANKEIAEEVMGNWLEQAYQAKIPKLTTLANTIKAHKWEIIAWYEKTSLRIQIRNSLNSKF